MVAPVAGAVTRAVKATAATSGGRVSRERMQQVRRETREKAKREKGSASAPAVVKPKTEVTPVTPAAKPPKEFQGSLPSVSVPQPVSSGAGFILALMFWTWIALPYLNNGGVSGVRAQLKAKFTNKAPDGSWLPCIQPESFS